MDDKRKIMVRDMGNPRDVLKKVDGNFVHPERFILGTILGQLTKIRIGTNGNGDEIETFIGDFVALNDDGSIITLSSKDGTVTQLVSKSLTLPGAWSDLIKRPFQDENERPVEFAIEVGVIRADNNLGWTWALNPIVPPHATDPVGRVMKQVEMYRARVEPFLTHRLPGEGTAGVDDNPQATNGETQAMSDAANDGSEPPAAEPHGKGRKKAA